MYVHVHILGAYMYILGIRAYTSLYVHIMQAVYSCSLISATVVHRNREINVRRAFFLLCLREYIFPYILNIQFLERREMGEEGGERRGKNRTL